ncbi:MAG: hypothetical protein RBT78_12345 [Kiritimatiellia bacterium]|jgi:hypothetical protein|nr:hypothetical protein [Kiritimatiellia bacterium]
MISCLALLLAVAAAGGAAGAAPAAFGAAAVSAALATWLLRADRGVPRANHVTVTLDPLEPDSGTLREGIREALGRVRDTHRPARLRIQARREADRPRLRLGLNRDGDLDLIRDLRHVPLKQPGVWIPDHPVPLNLPHTRCVTLRLTPAGGGRVRVRLAPFYAWPPPPVWALLAAGMVAACLLDQAELLAGLLGFAAQAYLLRQQNERAS